MVDEEDGGGMGFNVGSTWKPINLVAFQMQQGHSINESLVTSTSYAMSKFSCNDYYFTGRMERTELGGVPPHRKPRCRV